MNIIMRMLCKMRISGRAVLVRVRAVLNGSWISWGTRVYLFPGSKFKLGRNVRIGPGGVISVLPGAVLSIGDNCIINTGCYIYVCDRIEIGEFVRLSHYCTLLDHDYDVDSLGPSFDRPKISSPVIIGAGVWLGAYAMVMKGVEIGPRSVVGAKTMLRKSVPEKSMVYCHANSDLTIRSLE